MIAWLSNAHGDIEMDRSEVIDALRDIGLALNTTHNTVTTDIVGVEPNETSWRIDNSAALALLDKIEIALFTNCACPVCGRY